MRKRVFLIFATYIWAKTLFGLTFHPLSQTRQITRRPVLFPIIFSPILGLFILFIIGRIAALLIIVYGLRREAIALFLSTALISALLWQVLLLYLLASFLLAFWRNRED